MKARPTALETAAKALARRDRSAADLAAYLERRGSAPEEAGQAVDRLRQAGYVNDARFAAARAESMAARGYGDAAVRHELEAAGVAAGEVEAALAGLEPERERALAALARPGRPEALARRLAAKGFSPESVEAVLAAAGVDPAPE